MGGGLASWLPDFVKRPFWNGMAHIRHAVLGTDSTTAKAAKSASSGGKVPVGESSDPLVEQTINNFRALLESNPELARKIFKQNGSGLSSEQLAKVRQALPDLVVHQGASSTPTPPNARELGLPQPIADAPKPQKAKAQKPSSGATPQAYQGHYENSGDPNLTGVDRNDIHLKARYIAMNTAKHNIEDLRTELRGTGVGMTEAEFKAYCNENGIKYTPPAAGSYWSKID